MRKCPKHQQLYEHKIVRILGRKSSNQWNVQLPKGNSMGLQSSFFVADKNLKVSFKSKNLQSFLKI